MILKCFAILDVKVGTYFTPFFFPHEQQAFRAARDLVNDPTTLMGKHPADFALVEVGFYDDQTGRLEATAPIHHGMLTAYLYAQMNGSVVDRETLNA